MVNTTCRRTERVVERLMEPGKGRRGNGEGSLTKRPDGRWEARITLEHGKRKSFFARTRQAAARRLAEALRD